MSRSSPARAARPRPARVVVETLRRCWPAHLPAPLLSSFKDASLAAARAAAPEFARALLLGKFVEDWRARVEAVGAVGVNTNGERLTAPWTCAIKDAGFVLGVYTIDDPQGGAGAGRHGGRRASSPTRPTSSWRRSAG